MIDGKRHREQSVVALVSEGTRKMAADPSAAMKFDTYAEEKKSLVEELQGIEFTLSGLRDKLAETKTRSFRQGWSQLFFRQQCEPLYEKRIPLLVRKTEIVKRIGEIREFVKREKRSGNNGVMRDDGSIDLCALALEVRDSLTRIEGYLLKVLSEK